MLTTIEAKGAVGRMLSEIEVTYFRSRIEDVLREGRATDWQRRFLTDMQQKIGRYGTRTQLTEKQLDTLRRLTRAEPSPNLRLLVDNQRPQFERRRYRQPHRRQSRFSNREIKFAMIAVLMLAGFVSYLFQGDAIPFLGSDPVSVSSSQFAGQGFSVIDGDTIRMSDGTPVRLVGFNTPEKFEPQCDREAALGIRATERLRELVSSGKTAVSQVACSCKPGTEGTDRCNHGRSCGILRVDGQDVGQTLIAEGLAVPFVCGRTSCPPTPRPWCS